MDAPAQTISVQLNDRNYEVAAARPESAAFWKRAADGRWEDDTFRFLDAVCAPDAALVDVGAWIGPVSLSASPRVREVIALEPDPVAHRELTANIAANASNVTVWNAALDLQQGELKLYAPAGFGNSETTSSGEGEAIVVKTVTLADIEAAIAADAPVILKVDIEGHEYRIFDALIGFAKKRRATVHFSLHPRSIWREFRKTKGWLGARRATFAATMAAFDKLSSLGPVLVSSTGAPATRGEIFRLIYLKKRPKNFSLEVRAPL